MDSDFTLGGASIFYLVPVLIFGPLMALGLWNFGLRDLFRRSEEEKVAIHDQQAQREKEAQTRLKKAGTIQPRPVSEPPRSLASWFGRALAYGAFACVLALFSTWPSYEYWPSETAQLKLSISEAGDRLVPCIKRSREELAQLPPNMRSARKCSRERHPVRVVLRLDGRDMFNDTQAPAGIQADGTSSFYEKFPLAAGTHRIEARISLDDGGTFPHVLDRTLMLSSGQVLVLGYDGNARTLFLK